MIINICDTSVLLRNHRTYKEFRQVVKQWLKVNYLGKSFKNQQTGLEFFINNTFIEKVTSSFGDIKAHSFTAIPEIINNAVFIKAEEDKRNRLDITKILKFESLITVDGDNYEVWLYVRQMKTEYQLYPLNINVHQ